MVQELAALVGSRNQPAETAEALRAILPPALPQGAGADRARRAAFLGLAGALARRGSAWSAVYGDDPVRRAELLGEVDRWVFQGARATAADGTLDEDARMEAIDVLALAPAGNAADTLQVLFEADPSQAIQVRAIQALAGQADAATAARLLNGFSGRTPAVRRAVLEAVIDGGPRVGLLFDEISAGRIAATELDRVHVDRLVAHPHPAIAQRAKELLAALLPADRQQALADYEPALALAAEPARGLPVFQKNCSTCHRVAGVGVDVAPDISDTRTKTPVQLLTDILQPNRAIDANYVSYAVVTTDGRPLTGIVSAETATSVTLRMPENKTETLLRADIEELRSTGRSLMPDGLEKNIPPQEMADLISFLKNWRYLDGAVPAGIGAR
jgi:putative heme-binding domain-containing protein